METGSTSVLAVAAIAGILPQVVLGPFIGVWVDRWDRKTIMIASDSFIGLCSLAVALLYYQGDVHLWQIYMLLALRSVGGAFHFPAMQASVPLIAPENQLTRIAGVNQMLQSVSNIMGPALGALLVMKFSMMTVMMFDVAGAIIACITLAFVRIPKPAAALKEVHIFRDMKEGFFAIYRHKALSLLLLTWIVTVFAYMPVAALFPLMTYSHFGGGALEMGMVEVAFGVGMLAGAGFLTVLGNVRRRVFVICAAYMALGASTLLSGMLPANGFVLFVILVAVMGVTSPVFHSILTAVLQTEVAPELLGRAFSLFISAAMLPSLLGLTAMGIVGDVLGVDNVFMVSGLIVLAVGVVGMALPALKPLDGFEAVHAVK